MESMGVLRSFLVLGTKLNELSGIRGERWKTW